MQIKVAHPPNFGEIKQHFPEATKRGVLFAWGDKIFNPSGVEIPPWLIAHEEVHGRQHAAAGGPGKWWRRYIDDVAFRAAQELAAHQVEYRVLCQHVKDRNARARALQQMALRLSGSLYGNAMPYGEALRQIKGTA